MPKWRRNSLRSPLSIQRRADDRLRRRTAHALRPARGVVAPRAAGQCQDQSERRCFDDPGPEILHLQILKRVLLVDEAVRAEKLHGDEVAAADSQSIAE